MHSMMKNDAHFIRLASLTRPALEKTSLFHIVFTLSVCLYNISIDRWFHERIERSVWCLSIWVPSISAHYTPHPLKSVRFHKKSHVANIYSHNRLWLPLSHHFNFFGVYSFKFLYSFCTKVNNGFEFLIQTHKQTGDNCVI